MIIVDDLAPVSYNVNALTITPRNTWTVLAILQFNVCLVTNHEHDPRQFIVSRLYGQSNLK